MLNPFNALGSLNDPEETAVLSPSERRQKLAAEGLTLGIKKSGLEPRDVSEHLARIAGSLPTYAAAGAVTGPFVAPALARLGIAATPLIARTIGAGGVGALGGAIEGATGEQGALRGAVEGGLMGAGGEFAMIKGAQLGGKVLSKLRGRQTPDELVREMTQAPAAATQTTALARMPRPSVTPEEGALPVGPVTEGPDWRFGTGETRPRPGERVRARIVPDITAEGGAGNIAPYQEGIPSTQDWRYYQAPPPTPEAPPTTPKYNKILDPKDPDSRIYQANLEAGRMPWDTAAPKERTRLYRKYKNLPEEAPPSPARTAQVDEAIKTTTETPSPAMVDAASTIVPDLPTAPPMPRALRALPAYTPPQPELPTMQIATVGPNVSRALDETVAKADRLPFDKFVDKPPEPTAFFQPPPTINDAAVRSALEARYTPEVIKTAENMDFPEFQKYATQNPLVARVISESRATPESVWKAAQIVKDIPANAIPTRFSPVGKTPMFTEAFDETLGKKVLVPIDQHADAVVEQLSSMPYPRISELQFEPEQVKFLQSPEGNALLRQYDVNANNAPFLTSELLKKPAEEVEKVVAEMKPLDIIKPSIIKPSEGGKRAINLRKKMGISSPELENIKAVIKEKVPPAKQEQTLTDSILKRCE